MIFEKLVFTMRIISLMYPKFSTLMVKYEISLVLKRFLKEPNCLYKLFEEALNTHALIAHRRWYVRLIRLDFIRLSLFLLRSFLIILTFFFRNIEKLLFPYGRHVYLRLLSTDLGIISILFRCVFEFFSWFFGQICLPPWTCCPLSSVRRHYVIVNILFFYWNLNKMKST
jgi:hypothetical protein